MLRQDALWVKQNLNYAQRKKWVLDYLSIHMGFRWLNYGVDAVDEYGELLFTIRNMKPEHRQVLQHIIKVGQYGIAVKMYDGRCIEIKREMAWTYYRDADAVEWKQTPLFNMWNLIDWIEAADMQLWQPGAWVGRE